MTNFEQMGDELNAFLEYILVDNGLNRGKATDLWRILQDDSDFDEPSKTKKLEGKSTYKQIMEM